MNIAIVCGHYLPKLGYLEVHLARALAGLGHTVSVVTTAVVPKYVRHLQPHVEAGEQVDGVVKVLRLPPHFELGQIVIARGVKTAVRSQNPDLLIVIGLGKRFPKPVFDLNLPIISLFGDNLHSHAGTSFAERLKTKLLFYLLKATTYKAAIDKSTALVAYTPESFDAAADMLLGRFREKLKVQNKFISLGFDPEQFYFDTALRQKERTAMGIHDHEVVVVTATRVVAEKKLEACIAHMAALPPKYTWLVVGADDGEYAKSFAGEALAALGPTRFRMLPFANQNRLKAFYNASDAALLTVPAISVFEALGTGLPCLLPATPSLSHVLSLDMLSSEWTPQGAVPMPEVLNKYDNGTGERQRRAAIALEAFGWRGIARQLLEMVC